MGKERKKPGVMLYWETFDAMEKLDDQTFRRLMTAIRAYAQYGQEPDFGPEDPVLEFAWPLIRPKLLADDERYRVRRAANQVNGYVRSFKHNYAPAHGIDPEDKAALEAYLLEKMGEGSELQPMEPSAESETKTDSFSLSESEAAECRLPSVDQVRSFCQGEGLQMNPAGFLRAYGGEENKKRDWKSAARAWASCPYEGAEY